MVVGIIEKVEVVVAKKPGLFDVVKVPPTVVVPPDSINAEFIVAKKPTVVVSDMLPATLRLATDELILVVSNVSAVWLFITFKLGTFIVPVPLRLVVNEFPNILLSACSVMELVVVNVPFTVSPICVALSLPKVIKLTYL